MNAPHEQQKASATQAAGEQVRPTLIATIDRIFARDRARAQADVETLRQQTDGRGRRWISFTKAAALIQQARWPAETWLGQTMLGELARGEITLGTFRKRWHNVMTSEARLARMRARAAREQQVKKETEVARRRRRRRAKTTEKRARKR